MPDGLYERDALAWSEQHADLLRQAMVHPLKSHFEPEAPDADH